MLKKRKSLIITVFLLIHLGIMVGLFAGLLVYFKQREALHLLFVLSLVALIFLVMQRSPFKPSISSIMLPLGLASLVILSWAGPQLIYEIRPYTFYITGIVAIAILIGATSTCVISPKKTINWPWRFAIFLVAFATAYFLPWKYSQYVLMIISVGMLLILSISTNTSTKIGLAVFTSVVVGFSFFSRQLVYFPEQRSYEDKVLYSANTQFHKLIITQWQEDYWVFIDDLKNLSSIDDFLFYEPMAHSVLNVGNQISDVLVIGGENGCLIREIVKHKEVKLVDVLSYDTLLRNIAKNVPILVDLNQDAYSHKHTNIIKEDLIEYLSSSSKKYDAIFIDLPDPRSIETNQYYTREFYSLVKQSLDDKGIMITQAGSPYFATSAFLSVGETIKNAGFNTLPLHNQILTLGEWGWYLCSLELSEDSIKEKLLENHRLNIDTRWYNQEAVGLLASFGKADIDTLVPKINTLENPIVYRYYLKGNWDLN